MISASPTVSSLLVPLTAIEAQSPALVGWKAASLADCAAAGHPVPEGIVLTAEAFRRVCGDGGDADPEAVRRTELPAGVEEAVLKVFARLGPGPLAVRSSAVAEDLADASFAGQYDSVLGVSGPEQLVDAVRTCWASAFSAAATSYRSMRGVQVAPMAVLIQRQVTPRAAGVAFSADPISGDRNTAIVEAVAGLGDRLAAGEDTPETWRVSEQGSAEPAESRAVLTPTEASTVATLARDIAARRGVPQDIEWAIDADGAWLLQARPITALPVSPAGPVPVPIDIPEGYWERDASHWPAPHSPLGRSIIYPIANAVTVELCREFGMLAERIELTDIGGWHYTRTVPLGGKERRPPPSIVLGLMARLHPVMRDRITTAKRVVRDGVGGEVVTHWFDEWQPALEARHRELLATDLPVLSDDALIDHLDSGIGLVRDGLGSHMRVIGAIMVETQPLLKAARTSLGWEPLKTLELVSGLSFRSSEPGRELARLADRARRNPAIMDALAEVTSATAARIVSVNPAFAAEFDAYRHYYGERCLSRDPADPTLADRPDLLLRMLAGQIARAHDPSELDRRNAELRADRLSEARAALQSRSAHVRSRFDDALARAERAYPLREDNVFVALQGPLGIVRYAALEVGRRLAERAQLDRPDDVFFLEHAELRVAFAETDDVHDVVQRRKGERAWVLAHPGPAWYGTPPGPPPSLRYLPSEARDLTEAFFSFVSMVIDPGPGRSDVPGPKGTIQGIAGSPGRYTGTARVVMDEREFEKIQAGDVIVCPVTQPTWSVVFPLVGAIVTDSGGVLSHPAIIAREYGIPAVVATGDATNRLHDGEVVTVDGDSGIVSIAS